MIPRTELRQTNLTQPACKLRLRTKSKSPKPKFPFLEIWKLTEWFVRTVNNAVERGSTHCAGLTIYCHWKCVHAVEVKGLDVQQSRKQKMRQEGKWVRIVKSTFHVIITQRKGSKPCFSTGFFRASQLKKTMTSLSISSVVSGDRRCVCSPLRWSGPAGCESAPDMWGFLSPRSFPDRWGGRAPSAPDRARRPAEPPSWEGWRPAGWGVRGTGAPPWLCDRCCCSRHGERKDRTRWLVGRKRRCGSYRDATHSCVARGRPPVGNTLFGAYC